MSGGTRRGGIPGPESRTGLMRPAMTEAEFERRQREAAAAAAMSSNVPAAVPSETPEAAPMLSEPDAGPRSTATSRSRGGRSKAAKTRRVQRMFALEEDLDKKLWLYAIHVGKDRSEVVNDLLRPLVASMVLYDSRDRRSGRTVDPTVDRGGEPDGETAS
jgi:hypothetical protein